MVATHVDTRVLKAVAVAASKDATRYYLQGVRVEIKYDYTLFIATNGHLLLAAKVESGASENAEFTIPTSLIAGLKYDRKNPLCTIDYDKGLIEIKNGSTTLTSREIEGSYPDWRRITPESVDGKPAAYDTKYLADIHKMATILGAEAHISQNGEAPALIGVTDADACEMFGVLMPETCDLVEKSPEWCRRF